MTLTLALSTPSMAFASDSIDPAIQRITYDQFIKIVNGADWPKPPCKPVEVTRIWGQDRYETATQIADQVAVQYGIDYSKGQKFDNVVLASGNNWPDAISGAPLAHKFKSPILLLDSTPDLSNRTWDYINTHLNRNGHIYILGGKGVIPQEFTDYLISMGFSASNILQIGGADRDETSLMIAKMIGIDPTKNEVIMASDSNYYDALSDVGGCAAANEPLLLVNNNGFGQGQKEFVDSVKYLVAVGELSKTIESFYPRIAGHIRIGGNDEYDSNANLAERSYFNNYVFLATGENYPDALSGGALIGAMGAGSIVLTKSNELPQRTQDALNFITWANHGEYKYKPEATGNYYDIVVDLHYPKLIVLGGTGAVSDSVVNQVKAIMETDGNRNNP